MTIEIVAPVALVFAATLLGRFAYERHMDVLHGPYIEGRDPEPLLRVLARPLTGTVDRLRFRLRGLVYLAAIAAC